MCFTGDEGHLLSTVTYTMLPNCECGCLLNQSFGYIVASSLTYCPSERIWLIRVSDGLLIRLTFIRLNAPHGIIRVHDGNSSLSNLLLQIDAVSTMLPQPVTSDGNKLRVEYVPPSAETRDREVINGGFAALFEAVGAYKLD